MNQIATSDSKSDNKIVHQFIANSNSDDDIECRSYENVNYQLKSTNFWLKWTNFWLNLTILILTWGYFQLFNQIISKFVNLT